MILDVLIALIMLLTVFFGFQRGLIQPLLVELAFLLPLLWVLGHRDAYLAGMFRLLHVNPVLAIFLALIAAVVLAFFAGRLGGLIHRMPVVRGVDGFFGVFGQALLALLLCYGLVSALVAMDKAFAPTVTAPALTFPQVEAMKRQLTSSTLASGLVNWGELKRLEDQAKKGGAARIAETPQLNQFATVYEDFLQPQLRGSRLAPIVLGLGQRLPGVGRFGPRDLPRPPSPPPAPTPSPRKS